MSIQKHVRRNNEKQTILLTALCIICLGLFITGGSQANADELIEPQDESVVPVYRLYNDVTSEHLYTTKKDEASSLASNYSTLNWIYEGVGWQAPSAGTAVHRLYNPGLGNHLYTSDQNEINYLCPAWGWQDEGVLFYSGGDVPIYRLYNPFLRSLHLWTTDTSEYNSLPAHQWKQENLAFNAVELGSGPSESDGIVTHIHTWKAVSNWDGYIGTACNGCGIELTDNITEHTKAHALAGEPSGYHSHQWCTEPSTLVCTTCGAKGHKHDWSWLKPTYYTGTDKTSWGGYYQCSGCLNVSDDGETIAPYFYRLDPVYGRANAHDTWTTGYGFAGTDYIVWTGSTASKGDPMKLQKIDIDGTESMAIGESRTLPVSFTPASTTSDKTLTWTSDNPSVVSVNQSGVVASHSEGVAKITATSSLGQQTTAVVRVTAGNVGYVRNIKLFINGTDASKGPITVRSQQSYPVTITTEPSSAVYSATYSVVGGSGLVTEEYGSKGDLSVKSWEQGIPYTNPASSVFGYSTGTATLKVEVTDVNGNKLEARATVNVV